MDDLRFRKIFARAPVSIWEQDFSAVGDWLESLRERGVEDLRTYLRSQPGALAHGLSLVRLVEVNEITLRLWEVDSKQELLERWNDLFTDDTFDAFLEELLAIWDGRGEVTAQCSARTASGRPIDYEMHWVAPKIDGELDLEQVIVAIVDLTDHKRAEAALQKSVDLARHLSHRLVRVQEKERLHLSRELHDEFGQLLSAARLQAEMARRAADPSVAAKLEECIDILERASDQVRNLALELRPVMLDDFGLAETLRWVGERFQRRTGIQTFVSGHLDSAALPDDVGVACLRVVQEALTNISRHANARSTWIELAEEEGQLRIVVRDDGVGFDVHQV